MRGQIGYPDIDPIIHLGPLPIRWYGLMYVVGFVGGWWLGRVRARKPGSGWTPEEITDLLFYTGVGIIAGGRLGYIVFYGLGDALDDPLSVLRIYEGGMSFHGGLVGVLVAMGLYARKTERRYFAVTDFIAPLVPLGLFAGRIGNFINGELWGKPTDLPWGMVFPGAGDEPRHPSMLYEAVLEGIVLFAVLWLFSARPRPMRAVSGLFLVCYGAIRVFIETVRVPDAQLGYLAFGWVTMGMLLSLPMLAFGAWLLWRAYRGDDAQARPETTPVAG